MGCMWRRKRCGKVVAPLDPHADGRLPDGDTVLRYGAVRWTTLYRSERARTDAEPLMTPGQEYRTRGAPWLNGGGMAT